MYYDNKTRLLIIKALMLLILMIIVSQLQAQKLIIREDYKSESQLLKRQYFQADSIINACFKKLNEIDFKQSEMILVYSFYISDIDKAIKRINDFELPLKLDLKQSDSLHVYNRFMQLFTEAGRYRTIISQMKADVHYHFYKKALQLKQDNKYEAAVELFERSIKALKTYYPSYYELALLHFEFRRPDDAVIVLKRVYPLITKEAKEEKQLNNFADTVYVYYLTKAAENIRQQQFNEAITILDKASKLSEMAWIEDKDTVKQTLKMARQGVFDSYIQIIEKAMRLQKYQLAEPLILQADGYLYAYRGMLEKTERLQRLTEQLINGYYSEGKLYKKQGKTQKAENILSRANAICSRFPTCISCSEAQALSMQIKKEQQEKAPIPAAIVKSVPAEAPKTKSSTLIDKVSAPSVKPSIITASSYTDSLVKLGSYRAWAKDINGAMYILTLLMRTPSSDNDSVKIKAIVTLSGKISEQLCLQKQYQYNDLMTKATQNIKTQDFTGCINLCEQALHLYKDSIVCNADTLKAIDYKRKYLSAAVFQKMMTNTTDALRTKNYEQFFTYYKNSELFFFKYNIDQFGLSLRPISKILIASHDKEAILIGTTSLADNNKIQEAFVLLQYLRDSGIPAEQTIEQQNKIGLMLAKRDKTKNPEGNYNDNILTYTNNDKWYKSFRQAYIKEFRSKD